MPKETSKQAQHNLKPYVSVAEAIGTLLYPHAEVVIHDLASDTVFHIVNGFSRRAAGEPSLIGDMPGLDPTAEVVGPYEKANWNGERLKSITAFLTDAAGRRIGMLCINLDVSKFDAVLKLLKGFIAPEPVERPQALFAHDWREEINLSLEAYLKERGKVLAALNRAEKAAYVRELSERGFFEVRNAVSYVAAQLGVTRPTIYNYLDTEAKHLSGRSSTHRATLGIMSGALPK